MILDSHSHFVQPSGKIKNIAKNRDVIKTYDKLIRLYELCLCVFDRLRSMCEMQATPVFESIRLNRDKRTN